MATLIVLGYLCHADIIDRTTFQRFFAFQMATSIVRTYLPLLSSLYANIEGTIVQVRNRIYGNSYFRARQASGRLDIKKTLLRVQPKRLLLISGTESLYCICHYTHDCYILRGYGTKRCRTQAVPKTGSYRMYIRYTVLPCSSRQRT